MHRSFIPALVVLLTVGSAQAQSPSPNDLVRKVVQNELRADSEDHSHWMYKDMNVLPAPSREKSVVETNSGNLTCLNQIDNRPLTPAQRSAEVQRIRNFVADASAQRKALNASNADDQKSTQLFRMLPDAFLFTVAAVTGDTEKLTFVPNPDFRSHSMEEYVFHKMDGFVIVNTRENRLVEIAGTLANRVDFLGGLLGHLDPGGAFDVRLVEVTPGIWKISHLKVDMRGKVLFFKTIGDQEDEIRTNFHQVPDGITLSQAEQMLIPSPRSAPSGE